MDKSAKIKTIIAEDSPIQTGKLIVIAEDSITQAEQLKYILEKEDYVVLHGQNGKEAWEIIQREKPVLIMSDIMMPEIDGYELCRMVKSKEEIKDIPVILITALSDPVDIIRGLESGADNFITKPYQEKFLLTQLRRIVANAELRKGQFSEVDLKIFFAGKIYEINSNRLQILDLLLSTYETSIQKNRELENANEELEATRSKLEILNKNLQEEVDKRTLKVQRLNAQLQAIRKINQLIVKEKDKKKLIRQACKLLMGSRSYEQVWGMILGNGDKVEEVAQAGIGAEYKILIKNLKNGKWPRCCTQAVKSKKILVTENPVSECGDCPLAGGKEEACSLSVQMRYGDKIYGIIVVNLQAEYLSDEGEHELLEEVAGDLAFALHDIEIIEANRQATAELKKRTFDLNERNKELHCLYGIDEISTQPGITLQEIFKKTLQLIQGSLQYPGITAARIIFEGETIQSDNFRETEWTLRSDMVIRNKKSGSIEVAYLEERPDEFSGPFMEEEIQLLQAINQNLIKIIIRLRAEKERKEKHSLLSAVINNSPDYICLKDKNLRYVLNNDAHLALLGAGSQEEVSGKTYQDFFPEELVRQNISTDREVVDTGKPVLKYEVFMKDGKGNDLWMLSTKVPLLDEKGVLSGILSIDRNITEIKKAEIALQKSEMGLKQAQHIAWLGSWGMDLAENKLTWSDEVFRIFGLEIDQIEPGFDAHLNFVHPEDREMVRKAFNESAEKGIPFDFAHRIIRPDGQLRHVRKKSENFRDESGKVVRLVGTIQDITRQVMIENELVEARVKAENADRLKSAFLMNMSHEIRTPMNAIIGFSDLLSRNRITVDQRSSYIQMIQTSGDRLLHLIDDIIDISKIESGLLQIRNSACSVNKIIKELLMSFEDQKLKMGKGSIEIKTGRVNADEFIIATDPYRLKQVLSNLIDNALKYTEKGSVEIGYLLKSSGTAPDFLEFYVRDTGIGIEAHQLDIVFGRFMKIEDKMKLYGGAGLGLTISRNLIRLMGGDMWVDSEPGHGSTFFFTIPIDKGESVTKDESPADTESKKPDWKDKTILIVEDEESNFTLLKYGLEETGVHLIWAKNGQEGVDQCRKDDSIDLVIMDVKMPVMDGYAATRHIKKFRKELPVIAVTAFAMEQNMRQSQEAGCDAYFAKPIDFDQLLPMLNQYLIKNSK